MASRKVIPALSSMHRESELSVAEVDGHTRPSAILSMARIALAKATSLGEIKHVRDKAEAVRHYAKSIAIGLELHNHAAEIKLRAERKAGELLRALSLRGGDRKSKHRDDSMKLADLGIDANQSSRWQREATVPEDVFQVYVDTANAAKKEISAAGLLAIANRLKDRKSVPTSPAHATHEDQARPSTFERSQTRKAVSEVVNRDNPRRAIVQEVKNHVRAMAQMIARASADREEVELSTVESRYLHRLLLEADMLLDQLLTRM